MTKILSNSVYLANEFARSQDASSDQTQEINISPPEESAGSESAADPSPLEE